MRISLMGRCVSMPPKPHFAGAPDRILTLAHSARLCARGQNPVGPAKVLSCGTASPRQSRIERAARSRLGGPTCEREDFRRCGMAAGRPVHLSGRMRKQKPVTRLTAGWPCRRDRRNPGREQRRTVRRHYRVPWRMHDSQMRPRLPEHAHVPGHELCAPEHPRKASKADVRTVRNLGEVSQARL